MTTRKPLIVGPGALTFGEPGTSLDMSCGLTSCAINWDVDAEDSVPTLCGTPMAGERTYTAKISGTVAQDIEKKGVVAWTVEHRGKEVSFEFTPRTDTAGTKVTGTVIVDPIDLGGEVGKRGMSDFEWTIIGEPNFAFGGEDTVSLG